MIRCCYLRRLIAVLITMMVIAVILPASRPSKPKKPAKDHRLDDLNSTSFLRENDTNVFFVETSSRSVLNAKELCSVESVARNNPEKRVFVVMTSDTADLSHGLHSVYGNVFFVHVNLDDFVGDSPLGALWSSGEVRRSRFYISHLSDVLRFLLLFKYGGTYLDLDQIVFSSLPEVPNYLGREAVWIAAGAMRFQYGHPILSQFLRELSASFDGSDWGSNGPMLVSRVLLKACGANPEADSAEQEAFDPDRCGGVSVLPTVSFYPIPWRNWRRLFDPTTTEAALRETEESYGVHIWGRHSRNAPFLRPDRLPTAYSVLASTHCPVIYGLAAAAESTVLGKWP